MLAEALLVPGARLENHAFIPPVEHTTTLPDPKPEVAHTPLGFLSVSHKQADDAGKTGGRGVQTGKHSIRTLRISSPARPLSSAYMRSLKLALTGR